MRPGAWDTERCHHPPSPSVDQGLHSAAAKPGSPVQGLGPSVGSYTLPPSLVPSLSIHPGRCGVEPALSPRAVGLWERESTSLSPGSSLLITVTLFPQRPGNQVRGAEPHGLQAALALCLSCVSSCPAPGWHIPGWVGGLDCPAAKAQASPSVQEPVAVETSPVRARAP